MKKRIIAEIKRLYSIRHYNPDMAWQKINTLLFVLGEPVVVIDETDIEPEDVTLKFEKIVEPAELTTD